MPLSAAAFFAVGILLIVFARQVSTLKTNAWARFYRNRPKAAAVNPLSKHAGTEASVKTGAFMWRLIGGLLVLNGFLRLLPSK
jgi:hypothetical protein